MVIRKLITLLFITTFALFSESACLQIFIPEDFNLSKSNDRLRIYLSATHSEKIVYDVECPYRAAEFCENIERAITQGDKDALVFEKQAEPSYTRLTISYTHPEKKHRELLFLYYCSSGNGSSGIQYAIVLSDDVSQETAIDRIREFIQKNISLVTQ